MQSLLSPLENLHEVREMLLGQRQHYSANFLNKETGDVNAYEALRYIFEEFLKWTPYQVRDCLTLEIVKLMKMESLINRVPCPPELDRNRDFEYVAWFLYPKTKNCNQKDLSIRVYRRLIDGEIVRFPKGYFDGTKRGWFRAQCTFQYMLIEYFPPFEDLESLYRFFAGPEGRKAIQRYKLTVPLQELYETPLDYLHDSLSPIQKSEALYRKYKLIMQKNYRHKNSNREVDSTSEI